MAVAIFGGTFDPVHLGHTHMVKTALEEFNLSELVIVPNANPPHKKDSKIADFSHRYNMLKLAFKDFKNVTVSDYEKDTSKFSYSVDTMRHFRSVYGEDTYFVIGADSLLSIEQWHNYEALLNENRFIVFHREGGEVLMETVERYRQKGCKIHLSDMPKFDVSSTMVRDAVKGGLNTDKLLCPEVFGYIRDNSLYGGRL